MPIAGADFRRTKIVVRNQTILNLQTVSLKIVSEDDNNNSATSFN
jgi:hypothetical protein